MKRRKGSEVRVKRVSLLTSASFILLAAVACRRPRSVDGDKGERMENEVFLPLQSISPVLWAGLLTFNVCCLLFTANCFAEEWVKTYGTQYATIYYLNDSDLNSFTRDIGRGLQFFSEGQGKNPMLAKNRVDGIVDRVNRILDMYPPNFHFNIYIYPEYRELELKYLSMGNFGKSPIAFYSHKTKTIYVSLTDITDGVLAHEIAHAVINFFFAVPPPARMQEILAQYVDRHLWGE